MWEHTTYEPGDFGAELESCGDNQSVGTDLLLENQRVRVWEIRLEPGHRVPFHAHIRPYLWVCVDGGRLASRFPDGNMIIYDVDAGLVNYTSPTADAPEIHDLENVGLSVVRFTTVELIAE